MTKATYDRLLALAQVVAAAGFIALVDAAFLQRWQRDLFRTLSLTLAVPFVIVAFMAREPTLRERILQRRSLGADASEADATVLQHQLKTQEPFAAEEQPFVVTYDAERPLDRARSADSWHAVTQRLRVSEKQTDARAPAQHRETPDRSD